MNSLVAPLSALSNNLKTVCINVFGFSNVATSTLNTIKTSLRFLIGKS